MQLFVFPITGNGGILVTCYLIKRLGNSFIRIVPSPPSCLSRAWCWSHCPLCKRYSFNSFLICFHGPTPCKLRKAWCTNGFEGHVLPLQPTSIKELPSWLYLHNHFTGMNLLWMVTSLMLKSPWYLGIMTLDRLTRWNLCSLLSPCHKNVLLILSSCLATLLGNGIRDLR